MKKRDEQYRDIRKGNFFIRIKPQGSPTDCKIRISQQRGIHEPHGNNFNHQIFFKIAGHKKMNRNGRLRKWTIPMRQLFLTHDHPHLLEASSTISMTTRFCSRSVLFIHPFFSTRTSNLVELWQVNVKRGKSSKLPYLK